MRKLSSVILLAVAAAASQAATVTLDLNYLISGDTPGGSSPYGTLVLADAGPVVTATFSFVGGAPGEYVSGVYFNSDKALTATNLTPLVADYTGLEANPNPLGGVSFDYRLGFSQQGNENRLVGGETVSFTLTALSGGLSVADLLEFGTHPGNDPTKDGILAGMKIQGLANGGSAEIGAVPEPASMAALGLGAAALLRRRKKA